MASFQTEVNNLSYRGGATSLITYSPLFLRFHRDFFDLSEVEISDRERMQWRLGAPICGVATTKHLHGNAFNVLQVLNAVTEYALIVSCGKLS